MPTSRSRPLTSARTRPAASLPPQERLARSSLRLAASQSEKALRQRLIQEAAALVGAQRVLLADDAQDGPRVLGDQLPRGEKVHALARAITPWLAEARKSRKSSLRHGPQGARRIDQRSCLVVPLIAGSELLAYLYADVDGRHGRFEPAQRRPLEALAAQAAATLARLRSQEAMQARLAEQDARLAQHSAELALVNSVQQGMAEHLEFSAIIQLVGDKLREVFVSGDVSIVWWDEHNGMVQAVYRYEHGVPLPLPPARPLRPDEPMRALLSSREVRVANTRAEQTQFGIAPSPGTDWAHSLAAVPIMGSKRVLGLIGLQNHEREYAFGEHEVRLLETVAAGMGLALENALLFDETQQRARETREALAHQTAAAEVLQVIGSSAADTGPVFDKILECCERLFEASSFTLLMLDDDGRLALARRLTTAAGRAAIGKARAAELDKLLHSAYPVPVAGTSAEIGFCTGCVVEFADVLNDPRAPDVMKHNARQLGSSFANLAAPLMWEGRGIGILSM